MQLGWRHKQAGGHACKDQGAAPCFVPWLMPPHPVYPFLARGTVRVPAAPVGRAPAAAPPGRGRHQAGPHPAHLHLPPGLEHRALRADALRLPGRAHPGARRPARRSGLASPPRGGGSAGGAGRVGRPAWRGGARPGRTPGSDIERRSEHAGSPGWAWPSTEWAEPCDCWGRGGRGQGGSSPIAVFRPRVGGARNHTGRGQRPKWACRGRTK